MLENADLATVEAAADTLAERGVAIEVLLLNAGIAPPKALDRSAGGIEMTVASDADWASRPHDAVTREGLAWGIGAHRDLRIGSGAC